MAAFIRARAVRFSLTLALLFMLPALTHAKNGFDLSDTLIPSEQIFQGGPPKDGIPAIDSPKFVKKDQAVFLKPTSRVLGLVINGSAKAYPIAIMDWHEIVNDEVDGKAVAITYCPLCGTGMAFDATIGQETLNFGVSGLLYQSDVLLYDRQTESLWSQIMRQSVSGKYKRQQLKQLPLEHTTWDDWRKRYPETLVLSTDTGYARNYDRTPYAGYEMSPRLYFDVNYKAPAVYHAKEQVLGVEVGESAKAYPFKELSRYGKPILKDSFAGTKLEIHWNERARSARAYDENGRLIATTTAFWFAWYTFHSETLLFRAK